jgi:uncharacterized membrane protein
MSIAALSLCGVFLSTYLSLYKLGYIGAIVCGTGGCETVQMSKWAIFLGVPVAVWGVGFYLAMFFTASLGAFGDRAEQKWPSIAMAIMSGGGTLFSGWLTYLEVAEIHAICRYCVVSAVLVSVLFVLSILDWREPRDEYSAPIGGTDS